jgi:GNAT superfamily N-acetyltransferase
MPMATIAKREQPDHSRKPLGFGRSQARVQVAPGQTESQIVALMRSLLGRPRATIRDAANLAGAPDEAVVTVAVIPMHGRHIIEIQGESQAVRLRVLLYRRFDGRPILENDQIDVLKSHRRKGIGARLLGRQVEQAIRLGVAEIRGYAVRDDRTGDIGYWVWPLLGFDGTLSRQTLDRLPLGLAEARRISDLTRDESGRQWWHLHGDSTTVTFDLKPGSRDLRRFRAYLRRKGLP